MPTISDYIFTSTGGVLRPVVGSFVQLTNNLTLTAFVSTAVTTSNGLFTINNLPSGLYTVATGPTAVGPFTGTGDTNYFVGADVNSTNTFVPGQTIPSLVGDVSFGANAFVHGPGPWFDVKQFGAKGDGVTDDTTAIQNALNTARTGGGGIVFFPPGTYMLSMANRTGGTTFACALLIGPNTVLMGTSRDSTILRLLNSQSGTVGLANNNASVVVPWNVSQEKITLVDLTIDGNGANQTDQVSGIFIWRQRGWKLHRVRIQNCRGTNNSGGSTETQMFWSNGSTDVSFIDCEAIQTAGTCSNGFSVGGSTSVFLTSCRAIGIGTAGSFGFGFGVGTTAAGSREVVYTSCHAYLCGSEGFHIDAANVEEVVYQGCVSGGIASDLVTGQQYPFTANQSLGNNVGFTCIPGADAISYIGCIAMNNTLSGWDIRAGTVMLVNCVSKSNAVHGININTGTPSVRIVGGHFNGNTQAGINFSGTAQAQNTKVIGTPFLAGNANAFRVGATNYGGIGNVAAPAIPATGVAQINPFGFDAMVLVTGGTVSNIAIQGTNTGQTSGWFRIPAGESITLTYTVVPTWQWFIE